MQFVRRVSEITFIMYVYSQKIEKPNDLKPVQLNVLFSCGKTLVAVYCSG